MDYNNDIYYLACNDQTEMVRTHKSEARVTQGKIDIYTKVGCPYCAKAKALLNSKNVDFNEIIINGNEALKQEMIERSNGKKTVPQIFINDKHIGGSNDLETLNKQGILDSLFEE